MQPRPRRAGDLCPPVTAGPYRGDMETLYHHADLSLEVHPPLVAGPLLLFPVFSMAPPAPGYTCGPEAEAAGLFTVHERDGGAAVPELVVETTATLPLLLIEGETLLGVKQNRTLNVSVLCPPAQPTLLPVSCVEAGRWGTAQPTARSPRHAPSGLRKDKTRSVVNSLRTHGARFSDQGRVWAKVEEYSDRHAFASPTAALEDVSAAMAAELEAMVAGLRPEEGQQGVIVAAGGILSLDLFDKPATLAAYWDGLLAGYAFEAAGAPPAAVTLADAEAFAARVLAAATTAVPATGLGTEVHLGSDDVAGGALVWEGAVVHLAAFDDRTAPPARPIHRRR